MTSCVSIHQQAKPRLAEIEKGLSSNQSQNMSKLTADTRVFASWGWKFSMAWVFGSRDVMVTGGDLVWTASLFGVVWSSGNDTCVLIVVPCSL